MYEKTHAFIEMVLQCELPDQCKQMGSSPAHTHYMFLLNNRTNRIMATTVNSRTSAPGPKHRQNTVHAEISMLRRISRIQRISTPSEWRGTKTLISVRLTHSGVVGNSRVCRTCAAILKKRLAGTIDTVIFFDESCNMHTRRLENIDVDSVLCSGDSFRR
jgi:hypothetical protein